MEIVLPNPCECGGEIIVLTWRDSFKNKTYVDHGVCNRCFKNIPMSQEEITEFRRSLLRRD